MTYDLIRRLRLLGADDASVDPKASYATKPRELLNDAADRIEELECTLRVIAEGTVGPEQAGHYLAHRQAVNLARNVLSGGREAAPQPATRAS